MPDARIYEADTAALKNAAKIINDNVGEAREKYFKIISEIENIENSWSGAARKRYMEKLGEDAAELRRIIEEVAALADALDAICAAYDRGEEEIVGMLSLLNF